MLIALEGDQAEYWRKASQYTSKQLPQVIVFELAGRVRFLTLSRSSGRVVFPGDGDQQLSLNDDPRNVAYGVDEHCGDVDTRENDSDKRSEAIKRDGGRPKFRSLRDVRIHGSSA